MSSAAAVAFVKRVTREKCGHSGTLDPEVAGVLPIMVGRATRLQQYFSDKSKAYIGELCFSGATDTQDAQGTVIEPGRGVPDLDTLETVIQKRFLGDIMQTPPIFSAVKRDGKPLYAMARAGQTADIPARPTHIECCEILSQADEMTYRLRVECGSGTYIRTLFHDIGQALNCPAHMRMLIRTRSGRFALEDSVTCEQLTAAADEGGIASCLMPMDWPLDSYARVCLSRRERLLARNGVLIPSAPLSVTDGETVTVYDDDRKFFGVGQGIGTEFRMAFIAEP